MNMDFAVGEHVARGALVGVLGLWCPGCEGFDVLPTRDQMVAKVRARAECVLHLQVENVEACVKL
jgi:hypothetical protein